MSKELYDWLHETMKVEKLEKKLKQENLEIICNKQYNDIWKFLIKNIHHAKTVKKVKGNILIYENSKSKNGKQIFFSSKLDEEINLLSQKLNLLKEKCSTLDENCSVLSSNNFSLQQKLSNQQNIISKNKIKIKNDFFERKKLNLFKSELDKNNLKVENMISSVQDYYHFLNRFSNAEIVDSEKHLIQKNLKNIILKFEKILKEIIYNNIDNVNFLSNSLNYQKDLESIKEEIKIIKNKNKMKEIIISLIDLTTNSLENINQLIFHFENNINNNFNSECQVKQKIHEKRIKEIERLNEFEKLRKITIIKREKINQSTNQFISDHPKKKIIEKILTLNGLKEKLKELQIILCENKEELNELMKSKLKINNKKKTLEKSHKNIIKKLLVIKWSEVNNQHLLSTISQLQQNIISFNNNNYKNLSLNFILNTSQLLAGNFNASLSIPSLAFNNENLLKNPDELEKLSVLIQLSSPLLSSFQQIKIHFNIYNNSNDLIMKKVAFSLLSFNSDYYNFNSHFAQIHSNLQDLKLQFEVNNRKYEEQYLESLNKRTNYAKQGLIVCSKARSILNDWWDLGAFYEVPWILLDGMNLKKFMDIWKANVVKIKSYNKN